MTAGHGPTKAKQWFSFFFFWKAGIQSGTGGCLRSQYAGTRSFPLLATGVFVVPSDLL